MSNIPFRITLYYNKSDDNEVVKDLTKVVSYAGNFAENTSVTDASFEMDMTLFEGFVYTFGKEKTPNYLSIYPEYESVNLFKRYYFIEDIIMCENKILRFICHEDVLSTFYQFWKELNAFVVRNEFEYNINLFDEKLPVDYMPTTSVLKADVREFDFYMSEEFKMNIPKTNIELKDLPFRVDTVSENPNVRIYTPNASLPNFKLITYGENTKEITELVSGIYGYLSSWAALGYITKDDMDLLSKYNQSLPISANIYYISLGVISRIFKNIMNTDFWSGLSQLFQKYSDYIIYAAFIPFDITSISRKNYPITTYHIQTPSSNLIFCNQIIVGQKLLPSDGSIVGNPVTDVTENSNKCYGSLKKGLYYFHCGSFNLNDILLKCDINSLNNVNFLLNYNVSIKLFLPLYGFVEIPLIDIFSYDFINNDNFSNYHILPIYIYDENTGDCIIKISLMEGVRKQNEITGDYITYYIQKQLLSTYETNIDCQVPLGSGNASEKAREVLSKGLNAAISLLTRSSIQKTQKEPELRLTPKTKKPTKKYLREKEAYDISQKQQNIYKYSELSTNTLSTVGSLYSSFKGETFKSTYNSMLMGSECYMEISYRKFLNMSNPNYAHQIGRPCQLNKTLKDLKGYTEVGAIHLEKMPALTSEKEELEDILKSGFIMPTK